MTTNQTTTDRQGRAVFAGSAVVDDAMTPFLAAFICTRAYAHTHSYVLLRARITLRKWCHAVISSIKSHFTEGICLFWFGAGSPVIRSLPSLEADLVGQFRLLLTRLLPGGNGTRASSRARFFVMADMFGHKHSKSVDELAALNGCDFQFVVAEWEFLSDRISKAHGSFLPTPAVPGSARLLCPFMHNLSADSLTKPKPRASISSAIDSTNDRPAFSHRKEGSAAKKIARTTTTTTGTKKCRWKIFCSTTTTTVKTT